jgi:uncharacterized membrane protein YidH (DUF202 family)
MGVRRGSAMSRLLFGIVLAAVGLLYAWLAYNEVARGIQREQWPAYLGAVLFLLAAAGAVVAGMSLVRAKRR